MVSRRVLGSTSYLLKITPILPACFLLNYLSRYWCKFNSYDISLKYRSSSLERISFPFSPMYLRSDSREMYLQYKNEVCKYYLFLILIFKVFARTKNSSYCSSVVGCSDNLLAEKYSRRIFLLLWKFKWNIWWPTEFAASR